ncbi:transcription antitermination protein NusB [[Mycoplasma] gypis]|uniref:Transcription antitermination protein NusB n=1 Tax=[Mycoplasma] gypis TaxID=92404 RepID=A0ABZ2RMA8_9BACT|nr:transcription antitermination protein NusB [[Mycoplasma] gypis]MBN0919160.1 transcription antitermination protein NusB [[Mycoplasma] gypis]
MENIEEKKKNYLLEKKVKFILNLMQRRMKIISIIYQSQLFDKPLNSSEIFENENLSDTQIKMLEAIEKRLPSIESIIKTHLSSNWPWKRISPLTRAILIYGVFELQLNEHKIVINEMVNIAKVYGADYKFINAILDNIAKLLK